MGSTVVKGEKVKTKGNTFVACGIPNIAVASGAEAEFGALLMDTMWGKIACLVLKEMGHTWVLTPAWCYNRPQVLPVTKRNTTFTVNGDRILLGSRPGFLSSIRCIVAARSGKPCQLFYQTRCRMVSLDEYRVMLDLQKINSSRYTSYHKQWRQIHCGVCWKTAQQVQYTRTGPIPWDIPL